MYETLEYSNGKGEAKTVIRRLPPIKQVYNPDDYFLTSIGAKSPLAASEGSSVDPKNANVLFTQTMKAEAYIDKKGGKKMIKYTKLPGQAGSKRLEGLTNRDMDKELRGKR